MLLHQLGEDLVLALEFFLESSDLAVLGVLAVFVAFARVVEGSGAVLEELPLPEGEEVNGEVVLLAEVGDGLLLQEVESEQSDLLLRGKVPAGTRHGFSS